MTVRRKERHTDQKHNTSRQAASDPKQATISPSSASSSGQKETKIPLKKPTPNKPSPNEKRRKKISANTPPKKLSQYLIDILFYGLLLVILGSSLLFFLSKDDQKNIFGYRFYGVLTNSMVPQNPKTQKGGFHSGDIIIVKKIQGDQAQVNDIITFKPSIGSKNYLTHRVKKKLDHLGDSKGVYYITQGDANSAEDVPIHAEQVVGKKVFVIPKMAAFITFVQENLIVTFLILGCMMSLLWLLTNWKNAQKIGGTHKYEKEQSEEKNA